MINARDMAVKTITEQILPGRRGIAALAVAATLAFGGCGLDADEETSTATTPPTIPEPSGASGATGASGASGPTGPTGAEGSDEDADAGEGAGLGTEAPEPAG
jgi:hypothetical protein